MSNYPNPSLKTGPYVRIAVISVVFGLIVVGVSSALLNKINEEEKTYGSGSNESQPIPENRAIAIAVSIGIVATLLQLVASIALWCTQDRESKLLILGFIGGQILIQTILIVCLTLVVLEHFKPGKNGPLLQSSPNTSSSHGHLFWIILAGNIIFHFGVITYLIILVKKRSTCDDTEEMTPVVVHRRIPSRIPKTQRHGIQAYEEK